MSFICFILILILILWTLYLLWYLKHERPLNDNEIKKLSQKRIAVALKKQNHMIGDFSKARYNKNVSFNPSGQFYPCDISSNIFPSYIASQLFGKKHEWIVLGLVHGDKVVECWANKGMDRNSVTLFLSIEQLVTECRRLNATSILDLHNHPNPNPNKYNCLLASQTDKNTSENWFRTFNRNGISLFSFVCERGEWIEYFGRKTNVLQKMPIEATFAYIENENGVTEKQNIKLHKELGIFH